MIASVSATLAAMTTHSIDEPVYLAKSTVFIVENDVIGLHTLRVTLLSAGYAIEFYDHPEPLLSHLSPASVGCVVTALSLPRLDGLSLFRTARERDVTLPFVFVSGTASVEEAVTAMKQGAIDFLTKPVEPRALLGAVERALHLCAKNTREREEEAAAMARWMSLSAREQHISRLASNDWLNKQIALDLGVSESAVQRQRANAFEKLGVRGVGELTRLLVRIGDGGSGGVNP